MLGMEAMAKRMGDNLVGHHSTMPGVGKAAQAVVTTRCLKESLHVLIMTIPPSLCKTQKRSGTPNRGRTVLPSIVGVIIRQLGSQ